MFFKNQWKDGGNPSPVWQPSLVWPHRNAVYRAKSPISPTILVVIFNQHSAAKVIYSTYFCVNLSFSLRLREATAWSVFFWGEARGPVHGFLCPWMRMYWLGKRPCWYQWWLLPLGNRSQALPESGDFFPARPVITEPLCRSPSSPVGSETLINFQSALPWNQTTQHPRQLKQSRPDFHQEMFSWRRGGGDEKGVKDTRGVCVCELLIGVQHSGKTRCEKPPNQPWFTV